MNFIEVVSKARPNLKPGSLKSYRSAFNKAVKTDIDLNNVDDIFEALKDVKHTSRRNIYNSVQVYMEAIGGDKEVIEKYGKERDRLFEVYNKENESGIISDKQSPNFITYDELMKYIARLKLDIKGDQQLDMVFTILTFHIDRDIRNDLAGVKLITRTMFNKLKEKNECYIISQGTKMTFYCNQYQTNKTRPQEIKEIEGRARIELQRYIKKWNIKSGDIVFPITKNNLSQLLIKTSQKYIQKNIGANIIRKIVASHKFLEKKLEQEDHAKSVGHSVKTENLYYVKQSQSSSSED